MNTRTKRALIRLARTAVFAAGGAILAVLVKEVPDLQIDPTVKMLLGALLAGLIAGFDKWRRDK